MVEEDWKYIKIHKGINIDVFPMIPIPNKKNLNVMFKLKTKIMLLLLSKNNKIKLLKNKIIFKILKFIPRNISNKIEIKILDNMLLFNKEFDYYTIDGDMNYQFNRKWFNSSKLVQFEDRKYVIPSSYDAILKMCYNDYMKLPPKEERIGNGNIILIFDKNYEELKK